MLVSLAYGKSQRDPEGEEMGGGALLVRNLVKPNSYISKCLTIRGLIPIMTLFLPVKNKLFQPVPKKMSPPPQQ